MLISYLVHFHIGSLQGRVHTLEMVQESAREGHLETFNSHHLDKLSRQLETNQACIIKIFNYDNNLSFLAKLECKSNSFK